MYGSFYENQNMILTHIYIPYSDTVTDILIHHERDMCIFINSMIQIFSNRFILGNRAILRPQVDDRIENISRIEKFGEIYTVTDSLTKLNKGKLFELIVYMLYKEDPRLNEGLENIWMYNDIPENIKNTLNLPHMDKGIDIIAKINGEYHSIQCKFYQNNKDRLSYGRLSTFIALTFRFSKKIESGVVVTNCYRISDNCLKNDKLECIYGNFFDQLPKDFFKKVISYYKRRGYEFLDPKNNIISINEDIYTKYNNAQLTVRTNIIKLHDLKYKYKEETEKITMELKSKYKQEKASLERQNLCVNVEMVDLENQIRLKESIKQKHVDSKTEDISENQNKIEVYGRKFINKSEGDYIVWTTLKESFLEWCKNENVDNIPNPKIIKKYFERRVFKQKMKQYYTNDRKIRGWKGFKLQR